MSDITVTNGQLQFGADAQVCQKLEGLPGLKVYGAQGFARGHVDALAAGVVRLGYKPPRPPDGAPIRHMPGARDYQKLGVSFLVQALKSYGGAVLADDMGLGKTYQAIQTIRELKVQKVLVVAPRAACETWRDELAKWGLKSCAVLSVANTKVAKQEWEEADSKRLVVSSYHHDVLDRAISKCFRTDLPELVIMDEAHRVRGRKSRRSKKLEEVCGLASYRLALTATPQFDHPRDLWELLHILFGYRFGNRHEFDFAYCAATSNEHGGLENKGASNTDELKLRLSYYMLRREKREVAKELPPLQRQVRWVDGTPEARKYLQMSQLNIGKGSLHEAIVSTLKGKMEEALELAVEAKRFLLFTWLKSHAHELARTLTLERETPCVCITGELSAEKRQVEIRLAQAKGWGVVATLDSASESLNLQGVASVGIMHAIDWSPLKMAQAEGRLHRLGQMDPVMWYYVAMKESIDTVIIPTIVNKLDQWRAVMGAKSNRDMRHSLADGVSGPKVVSAEKEALKQLYEAMNHE